MILSEDSTPSNKHMTITIQPARRDTNLRNNDIIQASGPEKQAVYFGHTFHPDEKIVPLDLRRFYIQDA